MNDKRKTLKGALLVLGFVLVLSLWGGWEDTSMERRILNSPPADKNLKLVGFWHIGGNAQPTDLSRDQFVQKQAKEIVDSYLFSNGFDVTLNYVTRLELSNDTKAILDFCQFQELEPTAIEMEDDKEYFEFPTLSELHNFCVQPENFETVVFYVHSKTNDEWRNMMEDYLLGPECVGCLSDQSNLACGYNLKDINSFIWQHFSGNFWMTRCSHISKLNPPFFKELLDEVEDNPGGGAGYAWSFPPFGRSFAEFWVANDIAGERPAHEFKKVKGLLPLDQVCSNNIVRGDGGIDADGDERKREE